MALVSLDAFKDYLGSTGTSHDALLEACLDSAEKEVLNFCHRSSDWTGFEASTGTRYYRSDDIIELPSGSQYPERYAHTVLWLGDADLQSVDTLTNGDDTTISSTSYWLEPRNKKPYRYIRLKSAEAWNFDTDGEIEVTGTWGYTTAADATIANCVKELAKYTLNLKDAQTYDVTAMPDIGQITIPKGMPQHVKMALQKGGYVRTLGAY